MAVTLNHTIVPAVDNERAARFFAGVMGLTCLPPAGARGHFIPVQVNDSLTLDYMTVEVPEGHHLAFDVDPTTFDEILARLQETGVPYGNSPADPANGRIDHPLCPRGLFFVDEARNLYEVMSPG
ncbi:catechol 2,3-dioxygenase-like lactoylglutathione lyase family enzyme [Streptosporangium album]|uniref:Catechol 2,3-dioxygenase-like lactoylglutathione lyase family enzyme n=1 Tax=Streptosporangium album TaxID=47479 RepID=A0A7W7WDM9_9ACTN|nr:VOC family protein [Streptosporangium album]MBB4942540.1 catechol 2,3-dioxygenase-like lactoylglutathione lyase family enzyme [Streptosporangium album]